MSSDRSISSTLPNDSQWRSCRTRTSVDQHPARGLAAEAGHVVEPLVVQLERGAKPQVAHGEEGEHDGERAEFRDEEGGGDARQHARQQADRPCPRRTEGHLRHASPAAWNPLPAGHGCTHQTPAFLCGVRRRRRLTNMARDAVIALAVRTPIGKRGRGPGGLAPGRSVRPCPVGAGRAQRHRSGARRRRHLGHASTRPESRRSTSAAAPYSPPAGRSRSRRRPSTASAARASRPSTSPLPGSSPGSTTWRWPAASSR